MHGSISTCIAPKNEAFPISPAANGTTSTRYGIAIAALISATLAHPWCRCRIQAHADDHVAGHQRAAERRVVQEIGVPERREDPRDDQTERRHRDDIATTISTKWRQNARRAGARLERRTGTSTPNTLSPQP